MRLFEGRQNCSALEEVTLSDKLSDSFQLRLDGV